MEFGIRVPLIKQYDVSYIYAFVELNYILSIYTEQNLNLKIHESSSILRLKYKKRIENDSYIVKMSIN